MPFTAQDLIEGKSSPLGVQPDNMIQQALEIMVEHDYSQLPIIDKNGLPNGMVTSDSILKGLKTFNLGLDSLRVHDVAVRASEYYLESDVFDMLDTIKNDYAALVIGADRRLVGIITTYDTTEFFRRHAEDIMLVADIETAIREHIEAAYMDQITGQLNQDALQTAINAIFGKKRSFDKLSMYQYTQLLLDEITWSHYGKHFHLSAEAIGNMLNGVRIIRNNLAHFRGETSKTQREELRFAAGWFERNQPVLSEPIAASIVEAENNVEEVTITIEEETTTSTSRYAPLATYLQSVPLRDKRIQLAFDQIETIIEGELPASARQHRSWWANDSVSHVQSIQWLDAGWRVMRVNLTQEETTFTRIRELEQSYIAYFNKLLSELREQAKFQVHTSSPSGASWIVVKPFSHSGQSRRAFLAYSFAQGRRFRVELYIDVGDQIQNKKIFDLLETEKFQIETEAQSELAWERLNDKRASRIARYYYDIHVTDNEGKLTKLRNWAVDAMIHFESAIANRTIAAISQILK